MSKDIATNKIGGDLLCEGDKFLNDYALPNAAVVTVPDFPSAQTMGAQQFNITATAGFALGLGDELSFSVYGAETDGGTMNIIATGTAFYNTTFVEGDLVAQIAIPRDLPPFCELRVNASDDLSAGKVDGYFVGVC